MWDQEEGGGATHTQNDISHKLYLDIASCMYIRDAGFTIFVRLSVYPSHICVVSIACDPCVPASLSL